MAYRWSLKGPAFEFPTPYTTENRFLKWRAYALIGLAIVLLAVVAYLGNTTIERPAVVLGELPESGSAWPHVLAALVLAAIGGWDLYKVSSEQVLLLAPGQPASLITEVRREGSGNSPGAPGLQQVLGGGVWRVPELVGRYSAWLRALGRHLDAAPVTLHAYIRVRVSHLLLGTGLLALLVLAAFLFSSLLLSRPAGLALCALVLVMAVVWVLGRQALHPEAPALGPLALLGVLLAVLLPGAAVGWYADLMPRADILPRLGLVAGVAVLLGSGLLFDALGLLSTRAHGVAPVSGAANSDELSLRFGADPTQLLRDVDLELHRRWSEGVPNRRYVWLPPQLDSAAEEGPFQATVLEESQPLTPTAARTPSALPARTRGLLVLDTLGLLWSVAGGVLWVVAAWVHIHESKTPWTTTTVGLACLLAGGYAFHVAHLLWSRVEVESTLTWLEFKGSWQRQAGNMTNADTAPPVVADSVTLKATVAQARSVFYAAAEHDIGSRSLVSLAGQPSAAQSWTAYVQELARKAVAVTPGLTAVEMAERLRARERRPAAVSAADPRGAPPVARRMARFCSDCGTPVLAGAKFCQQCGQVLTAD